MLLPGAFRERHPPLVPFNGTPGSERFPQDHVGPGVAREFRTILPACSTANAGSRTAPTDGRQRRGLPADTKAGRLTYLK